MGLSEREQRILDQLENQLQEDDPRLARRVQSLTRPRGGPRELLWAGALFAVGVVLLLLLTFHPAFGVLGAAVMLFALVRAGRAASTMAQEPGTSRERTPRE